MFNEGSQSYKSDIVLGERYVDEQTGYDGVAVSVHFYQHACERVSLEAYDANTKKVHETFFDAPRLTHVVTGKKAKAEKTGGPARPGEKRGGAIR